MTNVASDLPFPGSAPCPTCGLLHSRCAQHNNEGLPCQMFPRRGEKWCKMHGGNLPNARKAVARQRAEELVRTLGAPIDVDPHTAILSEIRWSAGHVEFYRDQIQRLDPDALIRGVRSVVRTNRMGGPLARTETSTDAGPDIHVWLKLYGEERDRLARLCVAAIKAGIDERRVKVEETQAALLVQGFTWLQGEVKLRLDLDAAEAKVFSELLGEMLRRLDEVEQRAPKALT